MPATAFDQDGKTVLAQGEVRFISNEIDTSTGSVEMKAMFPNTDEALYANQFVNLRLQTDTLEQATVIPAQALQLSSDGSFVFVINADNSVTRRSVSAGPAYGSDQQVILSGVKPGDKVVTEGIDRLTTGAKVSVVSESDTQAAAGNMPSRTLTRAGEAVMNPSKLFIQRPVATILLMTGILLSGIFAYRFLSVSALPEVDYPTIQVTTLIPEPARR